MAEANERGEKLIADLESGAVVGLGDLPTLVQYLQAEIERLHEEGRALGHALAGIMATAISGYADAAIVSQQQMGVEHVAAAVERLAEFAREQKVKAEANAAAAHALAVIERGGLDIHYKVPTKTKPGRPTPMTVVSSPIGPSGYGPTIIAAVEDYERRKGGE